jgi:leucyl/phenylalanyl-tRNA---protein transferase
MSGDIPWPVEPPPTRWLLPPAEAAGGDDLVAVGADLEPGTLLAAYRSGLFPMHLDGRRGLLGWWSPAERGVLPLGGLRVSRSLRSSCRRYELRVDTAFDAVVRGCAESRRPGGWITRGVREAYVRLHRLGWAHSVEAWTADGQLAGGLYGVAIGGLFAGESMFHRRTDASKVALLGLVELLRADGGAGRLLDIQWVTPHLASLGAVAVPRARYLELLAAALRLPAPAALVRPPGAAGVSGSSRPRPATPRLRR